MGYSEDDAAHKIPHKLNALAELDTNFELI